MSLTWRARLQQQPKLIDMAQWPPLDCTLIPKQRRKRFLRNKRMIEKVLTGDALLAAVAKDEGVSAGRVTQLLNRCLGGPAERAPALFQGLVPDQVMTNNERRGCFSRLLQDAVGVRAGLDQMLMDRIKDKPWAEVPSPAAYHNLFKNLLARANWPLDLYPYTTASLAYESVRRDLGERWVLFCQARKARRRAFTASPMSRNELWLYDRIEIDEQLLDCENSTVGIELTFESQLPPLRLPRLTLLTAIDKATDCVLGFQIALVKNPRQDDLLALIEQCLTRWPERTIKTVGLEPPPGAGYPNTDPGLPLPFPREIALDNAWIHHAKSVESFVIRELGATLSYGRPKSPTVRIAVESCFHRLNQRLSHRLNSTTGSSVTDPKRESAKNRKAVPLMPLPDFEDALYVVFAEANHRSRSQLASATPMEALRHQAGEAYLVDVDDDRRAQWNPFMATREVQVHDLSTPDRKPFINFEYLRYKGAGLLALSRGESRVLVRYDRRDIRQLEAFRLGGKSLGALSCPLSWQSHPHSLDTRKYIFTHHRELSRKSPDPLTEYLRQLREQCSDPTDVAKFLRTYQEFSGSIGLPTSLWPRPLGQIIDEKAPLSKREQTSDATLSSKTRSTARRYWSLNLNPGDNHHDIETGV